MTVENDFLPFATSGSANVLTQAQYLALAQLSTGYQSGVAQSAAVNKTWRQSSIMSAVLAQFIVNSTGQPAIDDGTTATLLANLTAAISAQSEALIGSSRNLLMSVATASATATLTADEIVVGSALGGLKYTLASFSKTINLATTGAGGMDTGTAPVSGYVALYAIYNPTTQTAALLATNATSAFQPNVYGGANMPSGYTASGLVSVWPTNGSGQLMSGSQRDRKVARSSVLALSITSVVSIAALNVASAIPSNAVACAGILEITVGTAATAPTISVYANAQSCGQQSLDVYENGTTLNTPFNDLIISVPSTIYYGTSTTGGTSTYAIRITAYTF